MVHIEVGGRSTLMFTIKEGLFRHHYFHILQSI